jgi:enoyl-CoA hydratase/carnithine racemase
VSVVADGRVVVAEDGPVATITLDRPEKRNALTTEMYRELATALGSLAGRPDMRVVVLTGGDGAFTAGNDMADMRANPPSGPDAPPLAFLDALISLPQVLVAAVDGPAIGIGTTVLLHTDLTYATGRSTFALPFVRLGLVPEAASTLLLPATVGYARAAEMLLLGRRYSAIEMVGWGLINGVAPNRPALLAMVDEIVAELVAQPSAALLQTRRLLRLQRESATRERLALDAGVLSDLLGQQ